MDKRHKLILVTGLLIGVIAALLVHFGNPGNMGFCIACFLRDIAGAVKLHTASPVQFIRPEIIGLVIGAFIAALKFKEMKSRGGSEIVLRLVLGAFMMIGALVFLGCPLRAILRLGGGDLNAVGGVLGFAFGVFIGTMYLKKGFSFSKPTPAETQVGGWIFPVLMVLMFVLLVVQPAFVAFSAEGPGAAYAPIYMTLIAGLLIGFLAQRSGFCMAGGWRDLYLGKGTQLFQGYVVLFAGVLVTNLLLGQFHLGFANQPIAHSDHLWSFLGMALVGICAIFLGGCPLRQLIKSADGNLDSVITVFGMILGAAFSHNFGLASSAKGTTANGQIAVIIGLVFVIGIGFFFMETVRAKRSPATNAKTAA